MDLLSDTCLPWGTLWTKIKSKISPGSATRLPSLSEHTIPGVALRLLTIQIACYTSQISESDHARDPSLSGEDCCVWSIPCILD